VSGSLRLSQPKPPVPQAVDTVETVKAEIQDKEGSRSTGLAGLALRLPLAHGRPTLGCRCQRTSKPSSTGISSPPPPSLLPPPPIAPFHPRLWPHAPLSNWILRFVDCSAETAPGPGPKISGKGLRRKIEPCHWQ
jgi:hypothetical protein